MISLCAICTCVYLNLYFAIIHWDIFACGRHAKDLFLVQNIPISDAGDACSDELYSSQSYSVFCTYLNMVGVCFYIFLWSVPQVLLQVFLQVLLFLHSAGQCLLDYGLPPHLVHILLLLLLYIVANVWFGFRKVFLKLNPTSSITVKGSLPDEELAKAIAWLLNSKLSVISVIDIAGSALIPSSSHSFASGSLKPEINFIFTNSSSVLAAVLSFSKSQKRASSLRRARKLSSDTPTPCFMVRNFDFSAVTTLSLGQK